MGEEGGRRKKESETQNVRSHDHSIIYIHVCNLNESTFGAKCSALS